MSIFPRLTSAEPFIQSNLDTGYASAQLETALKRIRTGWRITHDGKDFVIYGPHGPQGLTPDGSSALAYYMLQCSLGPQQPHAQVWPRDMLPFTDSVATEHRYEREVTDGVETADANYERPR